MVCKLFLPKSLLFCLQILCPTIADHVQVVAAIAYGDETRTAGDSYDLGTCTAAAPHARYNPYTCNAFAPKIQSYCDSEDPNCCNGGTDPESHYTYADSYDSEATQFVLDQFNSS